MRNPVIIAVLAGYLAACTMPAPQSESLDAPVARASSGGQVSTCVPLYQRYDLVAQTMSTPTRAWDRMVVPPPLQPWVGALISNRCMTLTVDLAGMESVGDIPQNQGGAAISRVAIYAGVVTNMGDDARSVAFFNDRGVRAKSIGLPGLGRRVILGPFDTQDAYNSAMQLAKAAGFRYAYPGRP